MYFRKYAIERRENLTQSLEHEMQFSDAMWWRHNKFKMADGRRIENRFSLYLGAISAAYGSKFGWEMKNHMQI